MVREKTPKRPLLISHRGAHHEAPENSCVGFEIALAYGVDGIETDVQLSKDGIPVVYHDPTTCRVTGYRKRISDYPCDELQALDVDKDGTCAGIPTLAEVLSLLGGRTALLIEIKSRKHDRHTGRSLELTDKVVAQIRATADDVQQTIRILSFDPDVLARASGLAPQIKCVLNADGRGPWCVSVADLMNGRRALDFLSAVCLEKKRLSSQAVTWAHERGLQVFTYCCNTRPQVERALALGVDGIMSDKPGWLVGCIG